VRTPVVVVVGPIRDTASGVIEAQFKGLNRCPCHVKKDNPKAPLLSRQIWRNKMNASAKEIEDPLA